jgi:hypothetical protein
MHTQEHQVQEQESQVQEHQVQEHQVQEHQVQEHQVSNEFMPEDILPEDNLTLQEANSKMMKKTINVANLDNYVVVNHDTSSNEIRFIPMKLEIDLKNPELKSKGVKSKKKYK